MIGPTGSGSTPVAPSTREGQPHDEDPSDQTTTRTTKPVFGRTR